MRIAIALAFVVACNSNDVTRTLGARCDKTSECDDRCLVPSGEFPGGFCTVDCVSSGECPGGADCVDREGGVCLFTCTGDDSCMFLGDGWKCHTEKLKADPSKEVSVCRGG
jgi:hypothetical protein